MTDQNYMLLIGIVTIFLSLMLMLHLYLKYKFIDSKFINNANNTQHPEVNCLSGGGGNSESP